MFGGYANAWRLWSGTERTLRNTVKKTFGKTYMVDAHVWPVVLGGGLFVFCECNIIAVLFFLGQAFVAVTLLELVNYIEHYRLRREKKEKNGSDDDEYETSYDMYETVTPAHSWNAPQRVTNYFVFRLQRHSDHHANAQRPYQALCTYHKAPTLPTGYTGTMLVALFPKYFDTCLAPVLDELQ